MFKQTEKEVAFYSRVLEQSKDITKDSHKSIGIFIEELSKKIPKNPALYYQDSKWSWKELNEECNKIAHYFLKNELEPGESIALMLKNSPEYLFLVSGINKIQGINGLINYHQRRHALIHSFNVIHPKYIVIDGPNISAFNEIVEKLSYKSDQIFVVRNFNDIPHDFIDLTLELKSMPKTDPKTTYNSEINDVIYYIFTSGTTGLPKAIKMKHKKIISQGIFLGTALAQLTPKDVIYITTPLYHNIAIGINWTAATKSGAAVLLKDRFSVSDFWEDVKKYKVTYTSYVGEIPRYLLNQPYSEVEKEASIKYMVGLGLRKDIWEKFKSRFNVEHIIEYYGLTEGHRCFINIDEVPGMVGRYNIPGIELAKVDPETGEFFKNEKGFLIKCKNAGDVGMVLIRIQKNDFFGAYKDEQKTKQKMLYNVFRNRDMYFNTGDMLQLHENGWLSFYDRTGDTFRWKGENVSTLEVETILNSYPAIQVSAVYGVKVPNTEGKAGMATIKLNPSIKFNLDDFSRFVSEVLPPYSIPVFLRISDKIDLTGSYKVIKTDLKKEAYDLSIVKDKLLFWDRVRKKYIPYDENIKKNLITGKLKL